MTSTWKQKFKPNWEKTGGVDEKYAGNHMIILQLQICLFLFCFVILELGLVNISFLPTGLKLGFVNRGFWRKQQAYCGRKTSLPFLVP